MIYLLQSPFVIYCFLQSHLQQQTTRKEKSNGTAENHSCDHPASPWSVSPGRNRQTFLAQYRLDDSRLHSRHCPCCVGHSKK